MRVLHVYRTYFPQTQGGLEEVIRQICLNTRRHGVESRVLCISPSVQPRVVRREEAVVFRSQLHIEIASCSVSLQALPMFRRLLGWAQVVHYHFPWPFADVLHFAARVRLPTVLTYHSDIVRQRMLAALYAPLMTRFLKSVDRIVCTSPNYFASSRGAAALRGQRGNRAHWLGAEVPTRTQRLSTWRGCVIATARASFYSLACCAITSVCTSCWMPSKVRRIERLSSAPDLPRPNSRSRRTISRLNNVTFAGQVSDEIKVALIGPLSSRLCFLPYIRAEAFGGDVARRGDAQQAADLN